MVRQYSSTAADTELSAGITDSAVSISVGDVTGFPVLYPYTLSIDADTVNKELVEVTAAVGTTLTVTRGIDGTSAVSHTLGAAVSHDHSARDFREPQQHIAASSDVHGVSGELVGATSTQTITNKDLSSGNTFPANLVTTTGTQTLTNKTLDGASVEDSTLDADTIDNSNLVTESGAQTLTGKDLTSGNTFPASFVTLTGTQTLTNKTLTAPAITSPTITGTGTATLASVTTTTFNLLPAGTVLSGAYSSVPAGFLACDGAAVSRVTYATLFAAIGTTFGSGDGANTFNLPNLVDRFVKGAAAPGLGGGAATHTHPLSTAGWAYINLDAGNDNIYSRNVSVTAFTIDRVTPSLGDIVASAATRGTATPLGGATDATANDPLYTSLIYIIKT